MMKQGIIDMVTFKRETFVLTHVQVLMDVIGLQGKKLYSSLLPHQNQFFNNNQCDLLK